VRVFGTISLIWPICGCACIRVERKGECDEIIRNLVAILCDVWGLYEECMCVIYGNVSCLYGAYMGIWGVCKLLAVRSSVRLFI
jgi:hypothetical protein